MVWPVVVAAGLSLVGTARQGVAADAAGQRRSFALNRQANATIGSGHREAAEVDRQTELIRSRALAVVGKQGGSSTDVSVLRAMAGIEREGAARTATALYNAEQDALAFQDEAGSALAEGRAARRAANFAAGTNAVSAFASYGGR